MVSIIRQLVDTTDGLVDFESIPKGHIRLTASGTFGIKVITRLFQKQIPNKLQRLSIYNAVET